MKRITNKQNCSIVYQSVIPGESISIDFKQVSEENPNIGMEDYLNFVKTIESLERQFDRRNRAETRRHTAYDDHIVSHNQFREMHCNDIFKTELKDFMENHLTSKQKNRFVLHYFFGFTEREIAHMDSVNQKNIHMTLEKCRKKLKKYFVEGGIF